MKQAGDSILFLPSLVMLEQVRPLDTSLKHVVSNHAEKNHFSPPESAIFFANILSKLVLLYRINLTLVLFSEFTRGNKKH